jgi:transposase
MVWYLDEVFFGLDCSLSYTWMPKNTRMTIETNGERRKDCVIGTVCPKNGKTFFLQTEWMDSYVTSTFFKELSAFYPDKKHLIIADNVSYHKSQGNKEFPLPKNVELFFLPAYSPDLNPIERLWKYFKDEFLNNSLFKNLTKIKEIVYEGLKCILNSCDLVKSICAI